MAWESPNAHTSTLDAGLAKSEGHDGSQRRNLDRVDTVEPIRVLAVCLGNICRSPTAEAAVREAAETAGVAVVVESAGTGAWHIGERPDPRMRAAAAELGLRVDGRAQQIQRADFDRFDIIVTMDRANYDHVRRMAPTPAAEEKVRTFLEFDPDAVADEVPDPYYGGPNGFLDVVRMVRAAARGLVESLGNTS